MTSQWETVRIFISSTFDDMHAERDYLVKQVFPELREWCERRKLHLVDIDLRWGVKEEDTQNRNVVGVCLRRIDEARPFFLCFLGQRRGWVPGQEDISPSTLAQNAFPDLKNAIGNTSVTEMEILHALVNPFHKHRNEHEQPPEYYEPVKYAMFYLRDPSYLEQLPGDFPPLRTVYTNEGIKDEKARLAADRELEKWTGQQIPAICQKHNRPSRRYQAQWNLAAFTPELLLPLACPSIVPDNIRQWQSKWLDAGIEVKGTSIDQPELVEKARQYNQRRSGGRLTGFRTTDKPLNQVILEDLKEAIRVHFPSHMEVVGESDLQKELDQQEQFLYTAKEGFIERGGDFDALDSYVEGDSRQLFVLTAPGGTGKSSLLAQWLDHQRIRSQERKDQTIHYRFIGQSDRTTTVYSLLYYLLRELNQMGKLPEEIAEDPQKKYFSSRPEKPIALVDILNDSQKLRREFSRLLAVAGKYGRTVLVLDALNQFESGLSDIGWLPYQLPENIKLIVSFKRGEKDAEDLLSRMQGQVVLSEVKPFESLAHRRELVNAYLDQYLKQLDDQLLEALVNLPGSSNPLYLKTVLSELRLFGAFTNLGEKIRSDFGETPVSAFHAVLARLENDPAYSAMDPKQAIPLLFGLLSHAQQGLSVGELSEIIAQVLGTGRQDAAETVHLYLRQVRPFLAHREGRYDFFFDSFKIAALARYEGEQPLQRSKKDWHQLLADYFTGQPLHRVEGESERPNTRKLLEQPYQQACSGQKDGFIGTLTDYCFLETKCSNFGVPALLSDYDLVHNLEGQTTPGEHECLNMIQKSIRLAAQVVERDKHQLAGQLYGRLAGQANALVQSFLYRLREKKDAPWLCPLTPSLALPGADLLFTVEHPESRCHFSKDGKRIFLANSWKFTILDAETGAVIRAVKSMLKPDQISLSANFWGPFSDDGKRIIHKSGDPGIAIWDFENGVIEKTLHLAANVLDCAFSPDGSLVAASSEASKLIEEPGSKKAFNPYNMMGTQSPGEIRTPPRYSHSMNLEVFDCKTGMRVFALMDVSWRIHSFVISHDNRRIAVSCAQGLGENSSEPPAFYLVYDIQGGEVVSSCGKNFSLECRAFSPDDKVILSEEGLNITLRDATDGRLLHEFKGHREFITASYFSPDGNWIYSHSRDKTLKIWDVASGKEYKTIRGVPDIDSSRVSPNGKLLVTLGETVCGWDLQSYVEQAQIEAHAKRINACCFSADGKELITGAEDSYLKLWDPDRHIEIKAIRFVHSTGKTLSISSCDFSQDGTKVVMVGGGPGYGMILETASEREIAGFEKGGFNLNGCAFSPDGKFLVFAGMDNLVHLWDVERGKVISSHPVLGARSYPGPTHPYCFFSPDGKWVVSPGGTEQFISIWEASTGVEVRAFSAPMDVDINSCCFSRDGRRLVSANSDHTLTIWDISSGNAINHLLGHAGSVNSCCLSPDGKLVVSTSNDKTLRVWDSQSGKAIATFSGMGEFLCSAFHPNRNFICCGDSKGMLYFLELVGM